MRDSCMSRCRWLSVRDIKSIRMATGTFQASIYNGVSPPFVEMLWYNQTPTLLNIAVETTNPQGVVRVVASSYANGTFTGLIDEYVIGARNFDLLIPASDYAEFYVSMGPPIAPCNTTVTLTYGEDPVAGTSSTWGSVKSLYND